MEVMGNIITFIIPVRHPDNARNWAKLKSNLSETIQSIKNQSNNGWRAIIVANTGSDLPALPDGFDVKWVDFSPNKHYQKGEFDAELVNDMVRKDKGSRILAGLLHADFPLGHVMVVDDDDFINRNLTQFVSENKTAPGWFIKNGYIWSDGGNFLFCYDDFSNLCGTSHIIRSDLLQIPSCFEDASDDYIKLMLGSHIFIKEYLRERGTPLEPLPFRGAIYRTANTESHSLAKGVWAQFFWHKNLLSHPVELLRRFSKLRWKGNVILKDYFGKS